MLSYSNIVTKLLMIGINEQTKIEITAHRSFMIDYNMVLLCIGCILKGKKKKRMATRLKLNFKFDHEIS